jgi:hypothetical protein
MAKTNLLWKNQFDVQYPSPVKNVKPKVQNRKSKMSYGLEIEQISLHPASCRLFLIFDFELSIFNEKTPRGIEGST